MWEEYHRPEGPERVRLAALEKGDIRTGVQLGLGTRLQRKGEDTEANVAPRRAWPGVPLSSAGTQRLTEAVSLVALDPFAGVPPAPVFFGSLQNPQESLARGPVPGGPCPDRSQHFLFSVSTVLICVCLFLKFC